MTWDTAARTLLGHWKSVFMSGLLQLKSWPFGTVSAHGPARRPARAGQCQRPPARFPQSSQLSRPGAEQSAGGRAP